MNPTRTLAGRARPLRSLAAIAVALLLASPGAPPQPALAAALVVTTKGDSGPGSLREAIITANASPGLDTIVFAIPGSGVQTIEPRSALPAITDLVVIDGASQPGHADLPLIELSGVAAGPGANGLTISAGGSTVRALTINRFEGQGIVMRNGGDNVVEGSFIGLTADGAAAAGNGSGGLLIEDSPSNRVGGTTPDTRNVISGNVFFNVAIMGGGAAGNVVQGSFVGTDHTGRAALSVPVDFSAGIVVNKAPGVLIGGETPEARNVISGNGWIGVGQTPNDPGDLDDGLNDLQNYPVVDAVRTRGATTIVSGSLDSRPGITYRVELFAGAVNPRSGGATARRFLGAADATTDANGLGTFSLSVGPLEPDEWVSATATGPESGTSELSPPVAPTS